MTSLSQDAEPVRVLAGLPGTKGPERFGSAVAALGHGLSLNGRGLAAADAGNDGRMDIAINSIGGRLVLLRSTGDRRPLARREAGHVLARSAGHGGAPVRQEARARGAGRQQLPVLRGSARPLRARRRDEGARARRPLPGRRCDPADRRRRRPGGRREAAALRASRRPPSRSRISSPGARAAISADSRWRGSGTTRRRPSCSRGSRRRRRRRGISSISPPRCGTRGRRTTRRPTAPSSTRRRRRATSGRARRGDQLRGVPAPALARLLRRERAPTFGR